MAVIMYLHPKVRKTERVWACTAEKNIWNEKGNYRRLEKTASNVYSSLNVARVVKSMGMDWGRHVAPMGRTGIHAQSGSDTLKGRGHWGTAGGREISSGSQRRRVLEWGLNSTGSGLGGVVNSCEEWQRSSRFHITPEEFLEQQPRNKQLLKMNSIPTVRTCHIFHFVTVFSLKNIRL
jgi:hypothetical protein